MKLTIKQLRQMIKEELLVLESQVPDMSLKKLITKVLRHRPEELGITVDPNGGWVNVDELITAVTKYGKILDRSLLDRIVKSDNKQRFAYDETGDRIRANQGHTISVNLGLPTVKPPKTLYHGTSDKFVPLIKKSGLKKMGRHDVHLSADIETATNVGGRKGRPVILTVDSDKMYRDGYKFKLSANGVWLIDYVPANYITTETTK